MEGLIDTRNEYIEHIQDILSVAISKRIYAIYTEMMEEKKGLKGFQNELYSIRKWNNNIVSDEYKKIVKYTKCKYLSNLIKIIIITTIKIKIYEYREQFDNIKIKIPNPEDFVHKCYINAASFSWKNAYLYNRNNIKDAEYQNNLNLIEENIRAIIKKTFRDFVPFDEIFKQIEDNLTGNVKQFKDTGDNASISSSGESNDEEEETSDEDNKSTATLPSKNTKSKTSKKKTNKKPVVEPTKSEESEADEEEEDEEDEEKEEEDEEDEEEDEEDEEESEADEEEDNEAEADEADEADEEEENEADEEESEANEEESEADEKDNKVEKEKNETITVLKEPVEPEYNKINNIVDTTLTKYNDEVPIKQPQEISFKAFSSGEQTNKQDEERSLKEPKEPVEPDNISKEWSSIKDDYHSLSRENTKNTEYYGKRYENEAIAEATTGKYENDNDDAISVASVSSVESALSNITDVSMIKKIHIKDVSNKGKKPSFF